MVEWYHHSLPTIHHLMDMSLSKLPGVGGGQGGLGMLHSCGHKESDRTERLSETELEYCYKVTEGRLLLK